MTSAIARLLRAGPAASLALLASTGGCGSGADLGIGSVLVVATVEVTPPSLTIVPNQVHSFVATPRTSSGVPVTGRTTTWASSQPTFASVAADGTVRGLNPGTTRITATVDGRSGGADVTVSPIPIDRITVIPADNRVTAGGTVQLTATALDASGTALPGRPISWSSSETLIATVSNDGLVTAIGVGQVNILASAEGKSGQARVTVDPRPAIKVGFLVSPPASVAAGAAIAPSIQVAVQDATGATVTSSTASVTLVLEPTASGATLGGTRTVAAVNGVATFAGLSVTKAGTGYSLRATAANLADGTSTAFAVNPGPATQLAITTQPGGSASSGSPLAPQPVIQLRDAFGNPVVQAGVVVSAAIATGAGGVLGGTTTATTNASGVATFTSLTISGTAGTYTLRFTAPGLADVVSTGIAIGAGSGTQLTFTVAPPATASNGQPLVPQPVLQIRDGVGNPVAQGGVVVTAAVATGAGIVSGSVTATTSANGTATFSGLAITGKVGPYTLRFSAAPLTAAVSNTISLQPGPATQLIFATAPSASATSGQPLAVQPVLQLADPSGNSVATAGVGVTAALSSGPAGGSLSGTTTVPTDANGQAAFTNLALSGPAGSYMITFASTGLIAATSNPIVIPSGPATQLLFQTPPSTTAVNGQPLATQPVVRLADAAGSTSPTAGVSVTASVSGNATLAGTTTVVTSATGLATFTDLAITGQSGPSYTLTFQAAGLTSLTSAPITLTGSGAAAKLSVTTEPSPTATSGQAFATQPVVQVQDANGNPVAQAGIQVTAAASGGTLGGTATVSTNSSGMAVFTDLALTGTAGSYTLQFSAPGLTGATSAAIALGAGSATQLTFTAQPPGMAVSGMVLSSATVLQLRDGSGNAVAQSGVNVTVAIGSGPSGTLAGTLTVATDAAGAATFSDLVLTGPAGSYTLVFSSQGLQTATSNPIVVANAGTKLGFTTAPPATAANDAPFSPQPVLQVQDAGGNAVAQAGVTVTASIQAGPTGILGGTTTATTNSSGVATFTDLEIVGATGDYTLAFSATGLTAATATITLTPGAPAGVTITAEPTTATNDVALSPQPVVDVKDSGGNPVPGVSVTASIASGPAGTLSGTTTVTTSGSGTATFTNLELDGLVGTYTLRFTAGSVSQVSGGIALAAGAATHAHITVQPTDVFIFFDITPAPKVEIHDAGHNLIPVSVAVTVSIASGNGSLSTLLSTLTETTSGGVATFSNITFQSAGQGNGRHTLLFSSTGLAPAESVQFKVN